MPKAIHDRERLLASKGIPERMAWALATIQIKKQQGKALKKDKK